jgi:serine O-acetyltransferase
MSQTTRLGDLDTEPDQEAVFPRIVKELSHVPEGVIRSKPPSGWQQILPSRDVLAEIVAALRAVFFPGYFGASELTEDSAQFHIGATLNWARENLREQIKRGLKFGCKNDPAICSDCDEEKISQITDAFLSKLPEVRRLLFSDLMAAYNGDPAATCPDEAVFCYPGIIANISHRLAHELHQLEVPLLPRIIAEHAHSTTGIDIHPGATIGEGFFIDHGTGVVVGETCEIGNNVTLYQGVTLGAKSFPVDEEGNPIKGIPRHPIVEDNVIIYGGATILGRITIGESTVIGGNVWLTHSVPPRSKITQSAVREKSFSDGDGI